MTPTALQMKLAKAVALYKLFQVTSRTVRFGYRLQAQTCLHSSQSPSALPPTSHRAFCKMDVFSDIVGSLRRMKAREYATQAMNLGAAQHEAAASWDYVCALMQRSPGCYVFQHVLT